MKKIIMFLFIFIILINFVSAEEITKEHLEKTLVNQRNLYIDQLDNRDNNIDERIDSRLIDFKQDIHHFYNLFLFKISIIIIVSVSLGLFIGFMLISSVDSIRKSIIHKSKPIPKDNMQQKAGVLEQISIKKIGRTKKIKPEPIKPKTLNEYENTKPKFSLNYNYGDDL